MIKNKDKLIEELADKIEKIYKRFSANHLEVYLRVDDEGTGEMFTYEHTGNSYIQSDCNFLVSVFSCAPCADIFEHLQGFDYYFNSPKDYADEFNITPEQLIRECNEAGYDEKDIRDFVMKSQKYSDMLFDLYYGLLDANVNYADIAQDAIDTAEEAYEDYCINKGE